MNKQNTKLLSSFVFGTCLLGGNALGLGHVVFHDAFPGAAVDTSKWTVGAQWGSAPSVSDGLLTVGVGGSGWFASARTVDQFNFHQNWYEVTVDLAAFNQPIWDSSAGQFANVEFYLSIGPATIRDHFASNPTVATTGFHFAMRWRQTQGLDLYTRTNVGVPASSLSEVPAQAVISLNATDFSITLLDSGGGSIYQSSGPHGISDPLSAYRFSTMYMMGGMSSPFSSASIDSVTVAVIPEPSTYAAVLGLAALAFIICRRRKA